MIDLSYRWPHPRFPTPIGDISFRLHTFDNVYGIPESDVLVEADPDGTVHIYSTTLSWAGGQQTTKGHLAATITRSKGGISIDVTGEHPDGIRLLGVTIHDVKRGGIVGTREPKLEIPDEGRVLRYPNGWFDLSTPFCAITNAVGDELVLRSVDVQPRPKTFAFIPHFGDESVMDVELLVEANATAPSSHLIAPTWVVETGKGRVAASLPAHREHIRSAYPSDPWEARADVPNWMRDIALVLTLHGQHFTGRTFLDYDGMLQQIQRVCESIEGSRVLAYLPGWEGRYYRWYGRYGVDDSLGGHYAFQRLIDGAHQLGVHVMPMFGANFGARDIPGYERWGEPGRVRTAGGFTIGGSTDWDASRHFDHGSTVPINPAYKPWRDHLVEQIVTLHEKYPFDATFLDISAMYNNDPNGSTTEGLRALVNEIHQAIPNHLVVGEGWFDALADIIPLVQTGHREHVPVYHDLPDEDLFDTTNRSFGHVCLGDPAHGSSGVHEIGHVKDWRLPVRRGVIPTLSLVEDSLDLAADRAQLIVQDAHQYASQYLRALVTTNTSTTDSRE